MSVAEIGELAALILTIFVFTYLLGDFFSGRLANIVTMPYRIAVYIFAGLSAGFVAIVTYDSAIAPWLDSLQNPSNPAVLLIRFAPLILAIILLLPARFVVFNVFRRLVMAFLIGAGVAIATVGAISGTLLPLTFQTGQSFNNGLVPGAIALVGVICTLVYFQYGARRREDGEVVQNPLVRFLRTIGGIFIATAFGAFYAAAIGSTLTVFSERLRFLLTQIFGG
jgi:hypothetical protein